MSSGMTPSQLLEIRRVKAMVAGAGTTMDPQCFLGPTGPTGPTGPAGSTGNYGTPASLGYFNYNITQLIPNAIPTNVIWRIRDDNFSQGTTGIDYSAGKFYNYSSTDSILANVSGFISFAPNPSGIRSVYGQVNGINGNIYGYTQISAANTLDAQGNRIASSETIVPFSFNVYLPASTSTYSFFEIYVYQDSGNTASLTINSSISRISITRINTTMMGTTGATGPTGPASVFLGAADFFALMPSDNTSSIAPGSAISFPQNGPSIGSTITRSSNTQFNLVAVGIYNISYYVNISEAGQLVIALNSVEQLHTVVGRDSGLSLISQTCLIQTTVANTLLSIRNPSTQSTSLTITSSAGGNNPVSARITITRYS